MCMKKLLPTKKTDFQKNEFDALSPLLPLTTKERAVLEFIEAELVNKGLSPSYQEICDHFGFASFNSVQNYLKQLSHKGYLHIAQNQKRAIVVLHSAKEFQRDMSHRLKLNLESSDQSLQSSFNPSIDSNSDPKVYSVPFLGRVAAGSPIERILDNEFIQVPMEMIKTPGNYFALKVEGESMIDEGIFDGDFLIVLSQQSARDGDLVVASIEEEATVKRFFHKKNAELSNEKMIELRPSNSKLKSMWYSPEKVEVKGLVKALFRNY